MIESTPFKKVMIIDDSLIDRHIIRKTLEKLGFAKEIIEKESAQEALMYLKKFAYTPKGLPDIIFLDIRMPVLDGFDFLELYKCLPDSVKYKCRVYMLTGSKDVSDLIMAGSNRNVHGFLKKPLLNEELLKTILLSQGVMTVKKN